MTITTKTKAKTARLLLSFERAVADLTFAGAQPPEDHPRIEQRYQTARERLLDYINSEGKR